VTKGPTGTKQVRCTDGQDEMQDKGCSTLTLGTPSPALTCASSDEEEHGWSATVTLRQNTRDHHQYFVFAAHDEAPWLTPESEENLSDTTPDVTTDHGSSCGQQLVRDARMGNTIPRATGRVVNYEYTDIQEERQIRRLLANIVPIRPFGDAVDPFGLIPRYKTPGVDSLLLIRACKYQHDQPCRHAQLTLTNAGMRAFGSEGLLSKWFQGELDRDVLLSACVLASAWIDMHTGCLDDSTRTTIAKMETMRNASERLAQPDTRLDNSTLMVLIHLLAGELWSCNEKTLRTHQYGLAYLITQRGGMDGLENPVFAEISAS